MTALHNINSLIKNFVKWGFLLALLLLFLFLTVKLGINLKELISPTAPAPPTATFGKLPQIMFPNTTVKIPQGGFSYSIDTLSGKLPEFKDRTNIFKIETKEPSLLALERAKNIVAKIGFTSPENQISDYLFYWTSEPFSRKITYDILNSNFSLTSDYLNTEQAVSFDFIDQNTAIEDGQSFFNTLSSFPNDIDSAKTNTTLFDLQDNSLIEASSLSNAKLIRVDFFQKDVDGTKIFYDKPKFSSMNALIAQKDSRGIIIQADFFHNKISSTSATYYIKTADQAYTQLKKGQAYIADYKGGKKEILIKNVYLAFYFGKKQEEFLMPIIVFEGSDSFFAYVSAINEDWIKKD